jgi:hypothetical protein
MGDCPHCGEADRSKCDHPRLGPIFPPKRAPTFDASVKVPAAWQHTATLDAAEYQLAAMALAELSLTCPGFEGALRCLAGKFEPDARPLFDAFREYRKDIKR